MNKDRIRNIKEGEDRPGLILYWMSRDQRVNDNWALGYAQECALQQKVPLLVAFCLVPQFLGATLRQYAFMVKGLQVVEQNLNKLNIPFFLLLGQPEEAIPRFIDQYKVSRLITDFDPLRVKRIWKEEVAKKINIPFWEIDSHNIVPCWIASAKKEYGAYTFRPKMRKALPGWLEDFPSLVRQPGARSEGLAEYPFDYQKIISSLPIDNSVAEISWLQPGEEQAKKNLVHFLEEKLPFYHQHRNDPTLNGQSNLSPYLHFGNLSAQRVTIEVQKAFAPLLAKEAFLEELIIRRELADNFCYYSPNYDQVEGFPDWGRGSLYEHRLDQRVYLYTFEQLENGQTHDNLWNAAQLEMVKRGKMHGYLRMYWAKKILEWTRTPKEALHAAIYLNDKYELDGRDPNGYVGLAWSIGGLHDRAWPDRPITGKIRFMSYHGCVTKFRVQDYIAKVKDLFSPIK